MSEHTQQTKTHTTAEIHRTLHMKDHEYSTHLKKKKVRTKKVRKDNV